MRTIFALLLLCSVPMFGQNFHPVAPKQWDKFYPCMFSWIDTRNGEHNEQWIGVELNGDTLFIVGNMTKEETKWMLRGFESAGGCKNFIEPIDLEGATPLSLSALTPRAYRLLKEWAEQ